MEDLLELFRVGDKVWSAAFGHGEVVMISHKWDYRVQVLFDKRENSRVEHYTVDGKHSDCENRTLFFEEIQIPESALVRPKPEQEAVEDPVEDKVDNHIKQHEAEATEKARSSFIFTPDYKAFYVHTKKELEEAKKEVEKAEKIIKEMKKEIKMLKWCLMKIKMAEESNKN